MVECGSPNPCFFDVNCTYEDSDPAHGPALVCLLLERAFSQVTAYAEQRMHGLVQTAKDVAQGEAMTDGGVPNASLRWQGQLEQPSLEQRRVSSEEVS
jgi:hypothetical protein